MTPIADAPTATTSVASSTARLDCFGVFPDLTVAVFGDFSLDAYWDIRVGTRQISVETGLPVREVDGQRYSLGGAGNVAVNLRTLGVGRVRVVGVCGSDPFGVRMLREMDALDLDRSGFQVLPHPWQTLVYAKPYVGADEESRIDFGSFGDLSAEAVDWLLSGLARAVDGSDAVIVNQQIRTGMFSAPVIEAVKSLIRTSGVPFVVDARDLAAVWPGAVLKLNAREASALIDGRPHDDLGDDEAARLAGAVAERSAAPVFLTRGDLGIVVADGHAVAHVLPVDVGGRVDPVGAGDSVTATVAAVLASGRLPLDAGLVANLAAAVSVRELRSTGADVVTPAAIAAAKEWDPVYAPGLAADPTRARCLPGTEIEAVDWGVTRGPVRFQHAIFDHDGTLSTLREGWEVVMGPMMLRAVLGPVYGRTSAAIVADWQARIADFIDRTTGIQTLVQMQGLVDLVREAGYVPEAEILDHHGYKAIFNELLLAQVRGRVEKLRAGRLAPGDFQIKNAVALLRALRDAGITLHLASGTDQADVIAEATELGFAEFFGARIHGSIGDVTHEAKRVVLERIFAENDLRGDQVITFGDGPVELRETRRHGGVAVGVCSDELRRHGFNPAKRRRLIRGGANLLVGDYSDLANLLDVLGIAR